MPTDNRYLEALLRELRIQPRDSRELEDLEQSDEGTSTEERDPEHDPSPNPSPWAA
jgi:hypothetical protein